MQNEKPLASEKPCQNDGFHKTRSFFSCFCGKGGSFFVLAICSILFYVIICMIFTPFFINILYYATKTAIRKNIDKLKFCE